MMKRVDKRIPVLLLSSMWIALWDSGNDLYLKYGHTDLLRPGKIGRCCLLFPLIQKMINFSNRKVSKLFTVENFVLIKTTGKCDV